MDQSTSVGQLKKHGDKRASLRDDRNLTVRASEGSSTQGLEQDSSLGGFQVRTVGHYFNLRGKCSKLQPQEGRRSINQSQVQIPELQMLGFASPSNEQNMKMVALPTTPEKSRRRVEKLADENAGLRTELDALRSKNDTTFEAMDQMLSDLITTQQELEEKKVEITRKETELLVWRQNVNKLSTELEEKQTESEKMEKVYTEREKQGMLKKEREVFDLKQKVDRLLAELDGKKNMPEIETEVLDLRQKVSTLAGQLVVKEEQLRKMDGALLEQKTSWQTKLHELNEKHKAHLREQHERTEAEITKHQLRTKQAEARLEKIEAKQVSLNHHEESRVLAESKEAAALSQVEAEKSKSDQYLRELQELRASHAAIISQAETHKAEIAKHQLQIKQAEAQLQEIEAKKLSLEDQDKGRLLAESKEAAALSQVEAENSKADQYFRELQELRASHAATIMSQAETHDNTIKNQSQAAQQLQARQAAELEQLRRLSDFFKNNSKRLSRTTMEMKATIRTLQNSVQTRDREVDEQNSVILALRLQMEELHNDSSK